MTRIGARVGGLERICPSSLVRFGVCKNNTRCVVEIILLAKRLEVVVRRMRRPPLGMGTWTQTPTTVPHFLPRVQWLLRQDQ